jgi:hypothetical protein
MLCPLRPVSAWICQDTSDQVMSGQVMSRCELNSVFSDYVMIGQYKSVYIRLRQVISC